MNKNITKMLLYITTAVDIVSQFTYVYNDSRSTCMTIQNKEPKVSIVWYINIGVNITIKVKCKLHQKT